MFITCQECSTTYRLDEKLLKPTGSKVRCSQCQFVFVARPSSPTPSVPDVLESPEAPWVDEAQPATAATVATETFGGQELEGIDLAEFDALLEQDPASGSGPGHEESFSAAQDAQMDGALDELDNVDLDFDFETALEAEEDSKTVESSAEDTAGQIDLDMDFDILDDDTLVAEKDMLTNPDDAASLNSLDAPVAEKEELETGRGTADNDQAVDDMDLDLDFDLDSYSDISVEEEKVPAPEAQTPKAPMKDDLDLDDLDLELEEDFDPPGQFSEEQELSLDDDMGSDSKATLPEKNVGDDADAPADALDLDLDFDLELDLEGEQPDAPPATLSKTVEPAQEPDEAAQAPSDDIDDFDLSDLDTLMTTTGDVHMGQDLDEGDLDLDLDMDLDLDLDIESEQKSNDAPESSVAADLEDLDFSLDAEDDNVREPSSDSGDTLAEEEIDLSDIEQMLGSDSAAVKKAGKPVSSVEESLGLDDDDAIDIAEIESAIDDANLVPERKTLDDALDDQELLLDLDFDFDKPSKETAFDPEHASEDGKDSLEFDLEMEFESAPASKARQSDADTDELDLSDFGDLVEEDKDRHSNTEIINSGDIELEFQLEGDSDDDEEPDRKTAPVKRPALKAAVTTSAAAKDPLSTREKPITAPRPKPFRTKKKTSKPLVVLLILFMLVGGGYGLYFAVMEKGIVIPYVGDYVKQVGDYFNPAPADPNGILNLSTLDISNKFVDNEEAGRLFVITGKVRNNYSTSRDRIRMEGKLYTAGKVLAVTEHSYAGFVIDDQDLASLPFSEINRRLNVPPQGSSVETAVGPGQNLPFMLVFADLPPADQLDEFAIAPTHSVPRQ